MTKASFLLAVLCGMASLSQSLADPSMYGAAPPAKYPAPAASPTYPAPAAPAAYPAPAAPPTYPAPAAPAAPAAYPAPAAPAAPAAYPAPAKYEAPATTTTPKYETPAKYEEKKEEYPMKPEYKKEEYPPMKKKYGGKKYKRSIEEDAEEAKTPIIEDSKETEDPVKITRRVVQTVRDAVIQDLMSMIGETVNEDNKDLDELNHFASLHDGEEEDEEEKINEPSRSPQTDSDLDNIDSQSDPMMTTPSRTFIKERIRIRICLRLPECARRLRSWLLQPVKPLWSVRPLIKLPIRRRCFWKRVCY